ncbi:MAG: phosphoribosylformylglycinamidine synthase subunit PurS [Acidimicrobiia bacterium]|nr:phosphoribosylformylglycinamidine synthase subunit PurS [Acidimicrobiia bacterium]
MKVRVHVQRRPGIADPEGSTTAQALRSLGFDGVQEVSIGRAIDVEVATDDAGSALDQVEAMCKQLLTNPVLEDFDLEVLA